MDIALMEEFEQLVIETNEIAFSLMRPFYEKYGINYLKLSVLRELLNDDAVTMNRLSDRVKKAAANLSVVVTNMEEEGYVKKVKSINDKRVTFVQITPKGRDISEKSYQFITDVLGDVFGKGEDIQNLVDGLLIYKKRLLELQDSKSNRLSDSMLR